MRIIEVTAAFLAICLLSSCSKAGGEDSAQTPDDKDAGTAEYVTLQAKSQKRGVSYNFSQLPDEDSPLLGPSCSWSYNWGPSTEEAVFKQFANYSMDYCPMVWNDNWSEDKLRALVAAHPETEYLLAFNEPNLTDQANMTPQEAAGYWPRVVAIAKELGLKLISPAMNYGTLEGYHNPYQWLDEFFACDGVSLDDVDGIAVHCYMGSASAVMNYIDGFKKYGKPIWLTEFCNWANDNISEDAQMKYMVETVGALEKDPDVFRYAWFIPRGNGNSKCHNALLTSRLPIELTPLGKVYSNMSTYDKSLYYGVNQVIPAEHYSDCTGQIHVAPTTDATGILDMTDLKKDCRADYLFEVPSGGNYEIEVRFSTYYETSIKISVDGKEAALMELPNTEYAWSNASATVTLEGGRHTLTIGGNTAFPVSLNWMRIKNK
ncbi:MAG: glycosyl hydrolase [Candidatus Cryptobacteroides sp.]